MCCLNQRILGHEIIDGILKKGCGVGCIPNMEGQTKRNDDLIYTICNMWGDLSRWSFRPISAWSIEMTHQHRDGDHQEDEPHFIFMFSSKFFI